MRARWTAIALCVGLAAAPGHAAAQGTSAETAATALFDEARRLMGQQRYAEACPKFAESERLAPSGGTLLNLAECHERTGQTASAWLAWRDAAARANAAGKGDVEKRALVRAAALEPDLAKLTIAVAAGSEVAGLQIERDGVGVGRAELGVPIPVDPGRHLVEANAPEKRRWSAAVDVASRQTDARVTVSLEDAPKAAIDEPPIAGPLEAPRPSAVQKTLGIIGIGAGAVGLAVGAIFGLEASSKNDEALKPQNCPNASQCYQGGEGLSLTHTAQVDATISTLAFGAGAGVAAIGAVLWFTAPSSRAGTSLRMRPRMTASYAGLSLDGGW